jgi:hypothetical protein
MKPKTLIVNTATAGPSTWVVTDWRQNPFSVSFYVDVQGTGTYKVQHGFTDYYMKPYNSLTRALTVATLVTPTAFPHGLQVGDCLVVQSAGAPFDGTYSVATVVDANTVTYTVANSGNTQADQGSRILFIRVADHSTVTAKTTSSDGNYAFPVQMVRLNITLAGIGNYAFQVTQGTN